jgi:tetratricopeptide (TPR) repeat protein
VGELSDRAAALVSKGDFAGAREALEEALAIDPESQTLQAKMAESWVAEGDVYRRQGNSERAQQAYRQALELDPANAEAKRGLGRVSASLRQAQERHERIRKLVEKGLVDLKNEQYGSAYRAFSEVLTLDAGNDRAKEFREQARQLLEKQVQPIYDEGVRLYEANQLTGAVERFTRVLSLYPDHAPTKQFMVKARDRLRQEAIDVYKRAYIYEGLGRLPEALEYYQKALALLPDPKEEYHQKAAERIENLRRKIR